MKQFSLAEKLIAAAALMEVAAASPVSEGAKSGVFFFKSYLDKNIDSGKI